MGVWTASEKDVFFLFQPGAQQETQAHSDRAMKDTLIKRLFTKIGAG